MMNLFVLRYMLWIVSGLIKKIFWRFNLFIKMYVLPKYLLGSMLIFRDHSLFQMKLLLDITCVHYYFNTYAFYIHYFLQSLAYNVKFQIVVPLKKFGYVNSLMFVYPSANWLEREMWDMFGIFFYNHTSLYRILTDYGFKGHPLLKNFPLTGFIELYYDDAQKTILKEKVELMQEYRLFTLL
mgnify:FL=1